MTSEMISERLAKAFNEWMRRYTEEPEKFEREWKSVGTFLAETANGQEPTYGQSCAEYFTSLLDEIPFATKILTPEAVDRGETKYNETD